VNYPSVWSSSESEPSHRRLVVALRESRIACLRSQFEAIEQDQPEYVLISAEGISHLDRQAIESLGSLTRGHPVTIILYIRRWSELLPSLWQERVKHGHDETLPAFLSANLGDPFNSNAMNFAHAIDRYAAVFGRANIAIVSYSNVCDRGIDLAEHFLDTFLPRCRGVIDDLPPLRDARPNRSLPPREIEVIRALNSIAYSDDSARSSRLRDWYFARSGRFDLTKLHAAIDGNITALNISDTSSAVHCLHEALFSTCHDLLVQPVGSGSLFEPLTTAVPFVQPRYLANPKARETLDQIYRTFLADCRLGHTAQRR